MTYIYCVVVLHTVARFHHSYFYLLASCPSFKAKLINTRIVLLYIVTHYSSFLTKIMADNIVSLTLGVTVPFVIVCAASFALRVYSRAYIVKSFGADDWTMVGAFICWIGHCPSSHT